MESTEYKCGWSDDLLTTDTTNPVSGCIPSEVTTPPLELVGNYLVGSEYSVLMEGGQKNLPSDKVNKITELHVTSYISVDDLILRFASSIPGTILQVK